MKSGAARVCPLDDDKKPKSGLLRRWFAGADGATAPEVEQAPAPVASEPDPPTADLATQNVAGRLRNRSQVGLRAFDRASRARQRTSRGA